jgi:hypothetical protein
LDSRTAARHRCLTKLAERPDSETDFSDIPPLTRKVLAKRGPQSFLSAVEETTHAAPLC